MAAVVLWVGRIRSGRAIKFKEAAEEGLEEGGAGCDYADIELKAVDTNRVRLRHRVSPAFSEWSGRFAFSVFHVAQIWNLLLPEMNPIVKCSVWVARCCKHECELQDAHYDGAAELERLA